MTKKKATRLADLADETCRKYDSWCDMLEPEQQEELLEMRRRYRAAPHRYRQSKLLRLVRDEYGPIVGRSAFRDWLLGQEKDNAGG